MRNFDTVLVRRIRDGSLGVDGVNHFSELRVIETTGRCLVITRSADCNVLVGTTNHLYSSFIAETH